jgi:predicted nucleotidyltransferase
MAFSRVTSPAPGELTACVAGGAGRPPPTCGPPECFACVIQLEVFCREQDMRGASPVGVEDGTFLGKRLVTTGVFFTFAAPNRDCGNCGILKAVRANVELLKIQLASVWPLFPCLELAMVFGSVARGQSTVNSDLDVAVVGQGLDTLDLIRALENLQPREVHIIQLDQPSVVLLSELSREAVPVYERLPGAFANWVSKTLWQLEDDLPWYHRQQTAWLDSVARKAS